MKTRIVNKNALKTEGLDLREGINDYKPIIIGKIGLTDTNNPITSGSAFLMIDVYLFYKDFKNAS
jgi:hypothetical protein